MENRKQNIIIVHNYYQIPGGEDTVVANEKRMLEEHGHKVILYSRNNVELKEMSTLRKLTLPFITIFNPRTYRDIKRIIKRENIDIVHVHNTLNLISPAVYYAALNSKVAVVQTVHNFRLLCPGATFYRDGHICEDCVSNGLRCAIKHNCYRHSKLQTFACVLNTKIHRMTGVYGKINYICLTEFNKSKLLELKQIKPERVFVKPNFVGSKKEFVLEKKRKNQFVFAGRLDKLKGIDILFEAWKKLGDKAPKLIVCGSGPMEEWCKSFIQEYHANIEMRGFVSNEEMLGVIEKSKALVLPTQWYEGFPMSIVEAFSVGTPVVGSALGNVGDIIQDGYTGCCIKSNNVQDLISAINKVNSIKLDSVFSEYECKYSKAINYQLMIEIYKKIALEN